jgi:hypothetical protein
MAGARATLGIVRGGTVNGSERWGRAQRDGSGRPARHPWQKGRKRGAVARHTALGRRAGKEGQLPGTPPLAEGPEKRGSCPARRPRRKGWKEPPTAGSKNWQNDM